MTLVSTRSIDNRGQVWLAVIEGSLAGLRVLSIYTAEVGQDYSPDVSQDSDISLDIEPCFGLMDPNEPHSSITGNERPRVYVGGRWGLSLGAPPPRIWKSRSIGARDTMSDHVCKSGYLLLRNRYIYVDEVAVQISEVDMNGLG